jgi:hypothetical protein
VTVLNLGTAPAPASSADVAVAWNQYAAFDAARIAVTVV